MEIPSDIKVYSVLIVDDNPNNLGVLTRYLEGVGFEVMAARDGGSCLRIAQLANPGIILLDVMMPGLDGFETCKRLKANAATQNIPVIFMTALTDTKDKVKGFEAGAVDYVTKPLEESEVLARVTTHLRLRQLTENLENKVQERTEALNKAYYRLERLDRVKTDFIHITSHELRTPLNLISGYTEVLQNDTAIAGNAGLKEMVDRILMGSYRMMEVLNSIFDATKIDTKKLALEYRQVSLLDLFDAIRTELDPVLKRRKLKFSLVDLHILPDIQADKDLLRKAFYHLIVNAIKYTPDGACIKVKGRVLDTPDRIEVVIEDQGIGIDPEQLDLIFEKFYQTGKVTYHSSGKLSYKGGGPGLGLTVVKGIVKAHQGRVWAESEGHDEALFPGSRFYVQLPVNMK